MEGDVIEKAAKEAYKDVQENVHYSFEMAELAGYIADGTLELVYKQAFFAGVNWQKRRI